ncbi:acyl-CoA carboxylase subunit epsilon [Georgenia wutianyii]|uniref:Acyl-CoA carboxylase subunit epsilon n=1 Tax=Georgenia wutianyii TaxID=2585135 RepID=A0ABX5VJ45_9MICO|nr:acyl-CoA carboxylase subunit epsilon [Georgenia wutianyii]QDB78417.1 acyl-CoA carboxylase subunit epsilon [Georgenia wutianyii]
MSGDLSAAGLRVVRGTPDDVELAALVAGIVAARATRDDDAAAPAPVSPWADHARRLRPGPLPGPGSWRWSLHP